MSRKVKYPCVYRGFKHKEKGLPNNNLICTKYISKPIKGDKLCNILCSQVVWNVKDKCNNAIYLIDKEWYHLETLCKENLVIATKLDDCYGGPSLAIPESYFLDRLNEEEEKKNYANNEYRYEEVNK